MIAKSRKLKYFLGFQCFSFFKERLLQDTTERLRLIFLTYLIIFVGKPKESYGKENHYNSVVTIFAS